MARKKIIGYYGWKRFWKKAFEWFASQFSSIMLAIQNIDLSFVAKEAQATSNKEQVMGGKLPDVSVDILPAASNDGDGYGCAVGDYDYTLMEELIIEIPEVSVGTVFKATGDNSHEQEYGICAVPKTVDPSTLAINEDNGLTTGVSEWITYENGKCYVITGIYEITDGDGNAWKVFTYEEIPEGKSVREVYEKVENINIDTSDIAKQGTDPTVTLTEIRDLQLQEGIPRANQYAADIREIIGDWCQESESEGQEINPNEVGNLNEI